MKVDIAGISFPITLDLKKAQLSGTIPSELVLRELRVEVDKYDGYRIKHTNYNRWRINDIDIKSLTQGGVKVKVEVNLKKREKIASAFGKTYYTPWISVTLKGNAEFTASVKDNLIDVKYRSHDIEGSGWYRDIVGVLANDIFADEIESALDKSFSQFSGVSVISFIKQGTVIESGGINIPLDNLLNSVSGSVSIVPDGINFVVKLPEELVVT